MIGFQLIVILMLFGMMLCSRECNRKAEYTRDVLIMTFIGLIASSMCIPFIGAIFGFTAVLSSSMIIATFYRLK